jgi:transcriptional regulator with XRE-family HTH domain
LALRIAAGKTQADAAQALDCVRPHISQIENGTHVPRKPDLRALLDLYGALDKLDELEQFRQDANQRGWWASHKLPPWLAHYLSLETDAEHVRCFVLELVPGLVQTADYAREAYLRHGTDPRDVSRYVAARMERQRRIGVDQQVTVVMSEALLHRTHAMGSVGQGQLRFLASACGMPGVEIRVLPFMVGGHVSMAGSFTLFDFPADDAGHPLINPVAYLQYSGGGHLSDDPAVVAKLERMYQQVTDQSLNIGDSAAMIEQWVTLGD